MVIASLLPIVIEFLSAFSKEKIIMFLLSNNLTDFAIPVTTQFNRFRDTSHHAI